MKSKDDIVAYCLTLPGVYQDTPFDDKTLALRHKQNRKIFALFTCQGNTNMLNLKCEPMQAEFWRSVYPDVIPGYHMNKTHWNSLLMQGHIPDVDLLQMISDSYRLTAPRQQQ